MLAGHGFGNVDLRFEKPIDISWRHPAIGGDFRHGCLVVAVVLDALRGRMEDAVTRIDLLIHDAQR
ncbi:hypothetical protein D3C83_214820 [compost metagenome]